jgi:hypothetical protein
MTSEPPVVRFWRLYTDAAGVSRWQRCAMTQFALKSMQPPAAPQWQGEPTRSDLSVMVTVQPVGWVGEWHENPKPQWIVPLSGRWFVEAMDGERREFGPGEVSFGGDQGTHEKGGRKGHRSGTLGEEPAVLMVVQFNDPAAVPAFTADA